MSNPVKWRDKQVNFYNKYLLLLTEYTDEQADRQAECAVTGKMLWALKREVFLMQSVW
jgi:hypothetical protein